MSTTNKPSTEQLEAFEAERFDSTAHGTSGECMHDLSLKEQGRLQLRALLIAASASASCVPVGNAYFEGLRQRVRAAR
jgi:antitoxin ParD1/3/4